ncbi:MAG: polyisoprenoid-binding protein YceI [Limisphaerales bacterium]|jgi:polyisoprenoid-binding protein YceI
MTGTNTQKADRRASLCLSLSLAAVLLLSANASYAHWQISNQLSQLNFTTTKAGNIGEVHRFKELTGLVDDAGNIRLEINTASVDTLIPIRDERLQKILFQSGVFPTAVFTAAIEGGLPTDLAVGTSRVIDLSGSLTILDKSVPTSGQVLVTRVNARTILVTSLAPFIVNAGAFDLAGAVDQLREIAGLPSISLAVPVTFTLTITG